MPKLSIEPTRFEDFIDKILADVPYSFSRFGDGEWKAIFRYPGANCDGHQYFPDLGARLEEAVAHPLNYIYGMQSLAVRNMEFEIMELWENSHIKWVDADIFHRAFAKGMMGHMVQALKTKRVCLVGPLYLHNRRLRFLYSGGMIKIPLKDCFLDIERIKQEMLRNERAEVFAMSCSMATNVVIHELFPYIGDKKWMIDFGSVWDPCVGNLTRTIHKTYSQKIIERNME
jgi:hypothetical protein